MKTFTEFYNGRLHSDLYEGVQSWEQADWFTFLSVISEAKTINGLTLQEAVSDTNYRAGKPASPIMRAPDPERRGLASPRVMPQAGPAPVQGLAAPRATPATPDISLPPPLAKVVSRWDKGKWLALLALLAGGIGGGTGYVMGRGDNQGKLIQAVQQVDQGERSAAMANNPAGLGETPVAPMRDRPDLPPLRPGPTNDEPMRNLK